MPTEFVPPAAAAIAAAVGAIAGAIITPLTLTSFDHGTVLGFKGFSAAMLGGLGSLRGAVIGAFPEIRNIIQNYVEKMLNKELTPEKALELAEIDSTKAIREYNELF